MTPRRAAGVTWAIILSGLVPATALCAPHPPQTPPERALDAILRFADQDDDLLDNLFNGRGDSAFRPTADYRTMLTAPFLESLRRQQKRLVEQECGGGYIAGELCGMDGSPITCGQDSTETYGYETNARGVTSASITYSDLHGGPRATYQMILRNGRWMIGGVHCLNGDGR